MTVKFDHPATLTTQGCAVTARGFGYKHNGRKKPALQNIDLTIEPGQIVLLAGASGAGKSTFIHALAGVLPAEAGTQFGELTVDGAPPDPTAGKSGLVLQDPDSQTVLSQVGHDVAFGCENLGHPAESIPQTVRWALDTVGLHQDLSWPTSALSGGQKQRLALAGVLAMAPGLILLDEPTANIDPASAPGLRDAVIAAARATGATVVVIEHRLDLWADFADRLVVLDPEGVVADGTPAEVLSDTSAAPALRAAGLWLPGAPLPRREVRAPIGSPLLSARDLVVGRKGHPVRAGISLAVSPGEALALIGPNGAGKSTTALTVGGLLRPLGGEVVAGRELLFPSRKTTVRAANPFRWPAKSLARRIGSVFQSPEHQFVRPTVRAELELGFPDDPHRVDELLERLRLSKLALAHPKTLSGGEKRRLSVACMMAAPVLVVDEPTFGQDAGSWAELAGLFNDALDRGAALLMVTHDTAFIDAVGARVCDFAAETVPA